MGASHACTWSLLAEPEASRSFRSLTAVQVPQLDPACVSASKGGAFAVPEIGKDLRLQLGVSTYNPNPSVSQCITWVPKVGKIIAHNHLNRAQKAIILHNFGVQVWLFTEALNPKTLNPNPKPLNPKPSTVVVARGSPRVISGSQKYVK